MEINREPIFKSVIQTAKQSGESVYSIRLMIREGKIDHLKKGNRFLIHYPKFINYLEELAKGNKT